MAPEGVWAIFGDAKFTNMLLNGGHKMELMEAVARWRYEYGESDYCRDCKTTSMWIPALWEKEIRGGERQARGLYVACLTI